MCVADLLNGNVAVCVWNDPVMEWPQYVCVCVRLCDL